MPHQSKRDDNPESIEEPEVNEVKKGLIRSSKVLVSGQPFGAESHPSSIEFTNGENNLDIVAVRTILEDRIEQDDAKVAVEDDSQDFKRNNS